MSQDQRELFRPSLSGYTLGGTDAENYTLVMPTGLKADIVPRQLTITGTTAQDKTYDGSTTAGIQAGTLGNLVAGETLGVGASGTFDSANAGARTATSRYALSDGTGRASNYVLDDTTGLTATIARRSLTITGTTAQDKTYDGSTAAGIQAGTLGNLVAGETLGVDVSGTFDSANAGFRTVTASYALRNGTGLASNYVLADTTGLNATIGRRALTITSTTAQDKTYDGSIAAGIQAGTLGNLVAGETLGVDASGTFDSANAGARTVTARYALSNGTGRASNYVLADTSGLSANIAKRQLTITGTTAQDKTYDGSTTAGIQAGTLGNLVAGETLGVDATGTFDSANAGARTATSRYALSDGTGRASNYVLADTSGLNATIARRALTITGTTVQGKTYDGSTAAGIQAGTLGNLVAGETLGVDASGTFDSANAGAPTATARYVLSDGTGRASNYVLADTTGLNATIGRRALTITGTAAQDKTYDGSTTAAIQAGTLGNLVAGESLGVSATGTFDSANAGTRTATATYTLSDGTGRASNYVLADTTSLSANIAKARLTVIANDDRKIADGQPYNGGNGAQFMGFVHGENASVLGGQLRYGGTAQGARTIGEYTITVGGLETANYRLDYVDGHLLISAAPTTGVPTAGDIERPIRQQMQAHEGLARLGHDLNNATLPAPASTLPLVVAHDYIRLEE
ncbi:hypothetical protein XthCFBP4691_19880 [Xanthomonas theicola]|uniref:MBG domain-containing protein n=1 Tax=Xanthomonas theicola TaxID=56464 RepID=A0A2S6Z1U4_9XANT|nr:hypothetical protein XthCFBP4691_19880 [Xanthomonas theicola]